MRFLLTLIIADMIMCTFSVVFVPSYFMELSLLVSYFFFNFSCFYSVKCRALLNTLTLLNLNTVGRVSNLLFYLNCTIEQFDHKTLCAHGNHTLALKESLRKKNEIGLTREKNVSEQKEW